MIVLCTFLLACSSEKKNTESKDRKLCFVDAGGSFGKSGLRARQYVGKGPKFRMIQWKTLDFPDDLIIQDGQQTYDNHASVAVRLSWRVSEVNGSVESQLDSFEAVPINFKTEQLQNIASWRLIGVDGDKFDFPASSAPKEGKIELFSSESKGVNISGNLAEDLGGVNGSSFRIALIDANGIVLLQKQILASSGYMFKDRAVSALEKLDELSKTPDNCLSVSY